MGVGFAFLRSGPHWQALRFRNLAPAARLAHFLTFLIGSRPLKIGMGSRSDNRDSALLALLAWEERLARWQMFPQASRTAFVAQLSDLMMKVACAERDDERRREDQGTPS